jgi:copper chaperone NosL
MEMKKVYALTPVVAVCLIFAVMAFAQTKDDISVHRTCSHCGMDRGMFDFSRMLIEYDDGAVSALCSLHCAAIDLANNIDRTPVSIKVADFNGKELIDAEKAFWALGGNRPGVMSGRGKWAFDARDDADRFIGTNQGELATFEEAMMTAYEDMYADTKMIRDKRKMRRAKVDKHH